MDASDPFDWFMQNGPQQPDQAAVARARAQLQQPMQPEEQDSLLQKVAGAGASGLSYAAGTLDKLFGGRAIRGALGGNARELLSAIPGSDMLGITNPEDRVSGEQLLKNAGILEGDGTKGEFELRDLAGPALEAALDPGTYLTFGAGALTKSGQVAKRIGALPESMAGRIAGHATAEDIAKAMGRPLAEATQAAQGVGVNLNDLIGKPLGGVAGLRVPFGETAKVLGTGPVGQKIANTLGSVYDKALYSAPGRYLSAAFDPQVEGALNSGVQRNWRAESTAIRTRDVQRRLDALGIAQPLMDVGMPELDTASGPLRGMVEGTRQFPGPYSPEVLDALNTSASRLTALNQSNLARAQAAGLKLEDLSSVHGTNYTGRSPTPLEQAAGVKKGMPTEQFSHQLYAGIGPGIQRQELLDVPGGTDAINAMVKDPRIGTRARTLKKVQDIQDVLSKEYIKPDPARLAQIRGIEDAELASRQALDTANGNTALVDEFKKFGLDPVKYPLLAEEKQVLASKEAQMQGLPSYLGGLDPRRLNTGLFGNSVISDTLSAQQGIDRAIARANVATRTLSDVAINSPQQPGFTKLQDLLNNLKLSNEAGFNIVDQMGARGRGVKDFQHVQIPDDTAAAVQALAQKLKGPDYVSGPLGLFDSATNLTRTLQTAPWPGKHVRDLTTAAVQNLQAGSPGATTFGIPTIKALREGGDVKGLASAIPAFAGMTDAEATAALRRELFSQSAAGSGMGGLAREGIMPASPAAASFTKAIPGLEPAPGLGQIAKDFIPKSAAEANPLNVAAFNGRTTSKFAPAAAGRELGDLVDDLGRGGLYTDLRRQGYTPDAAGKLTQDTQFNYRLSDFESKVMKRIAPFYSWLRQVMPQQAGFLAQAPGGISGQAIRAADAMHQKEGFTPPYLEGGMAVPLGSEQDGTQRYLTRMDLPWEQPFSILNTGPHGAQTTMMSLLSELNPLIKGPLEYATNKQFMSGRDLDSLYARTGNRTLDQVLMNSPVSRALTTAGTLADERKGWLPTLFNLGTGARVTDVDMNKQRQQVGLDAVREALKATPNAKRFEDLYVPAEQLPSLSPDEMNLYRLYRGLEAKAAKDSKARKKQAIMGG